MAVRASVFYQGYRYNASIGPDGTKHYAMGSEAELVERLTRDGHKRWWIAENQVEHIIRPDQLTLESMLGRAMRSGRGLFRLRPPAIEAHLFGLPRWAFRVMFQHGAAAVKNRIFRAKTKYFYHRWYWNYYKGFLMEAEAAKKKQRQAAPAPDEGNAAPKIAR
jgi:hypothetical protein